MLPPNTIHKLMSRSAVYGTKYNKHYKWISTDCPIVSVVVAMSPNASESEMHWWGTRTIWIGLFIARLLKCKKTLSVESSLWSKKAYYCGSCLEFSPSKDCFINLHLSYTVCRQMQMPNILLIRFSTDRLNAIEGVRCSDGFTLICLLHQLMSSVLNQCSVTMTEIVSCFSMPSMFGNRQLPPTELPLLS